MAFGYIQKNIHTELCVKALERIEMVSGGLLCKAVCWENMLIYYHCIRGNNNPESTGIRRLLITRFRSAALIFTPPELFLFSLPSFRGFLGRHRRSRARGGSDRTLYVSEHANCHYSWIRCGEASGLHARQGSGQGRSQRSRVQTSAERLSWKTCVCVCVCERMYCMSAVFHGGMTGAKPCHGLCDLNLFWSLVRALILWFCLDTLVFYTAACPRLREHHTIWNLNEDHIIFWRRTPTLIVKNVSCNEETGFSRLCEFTARPRDLYSRFGLGCSVGEAMTGQRAAPSACTPVQ